MALNPITPWLAAIVGILAAGLATAYASLDQYSERNEYRVEHHGTGSQAGASSPRRTQTFDEQLERIDLRTVPNRALQDRSYEIEFINLEDDENPNIARFPTDLAWPQKKFPSLVFYNPEYNLLMKKSNKNLEAQDLEINPQKRSSTLLKIETSETKNDNNGTVPVVLSIQELLKQWGIDITYQKPKRPQRGDIEIIDPKDLNRGDIPASTLYSDSLIKSKRYNGRKLLWDENNEKEMWGFAEDDGLLQSDEPSDSEDDDQEQVTYTDSYHRHSHPSDPRLEERKKQEEERNRYRDQERQRIAEEQRRRSEFRSQPEPVNQDRKTVTNGNDSNTSDPRLDERKHQEERRKKMEQERQRLVEEQIKRNELNRQLDRVNEGITTVSYSNVPSGSDPRIEGRRTQEGSNRYGNEEQRRAEEQRRRIESHTESAGVNEDKRTVTNSNNSYISDPSIDERRKEQEKRRKQQEQERQRIAEEQRKRDDAYLESERVSEDRKAFSNANNSYSSDPRIDERRKQEEQRRKQWEQERQRIAEEQRRREGDNLRHEDVNIGRKIVMNANNSNSSDPRIDQRRKQEEQRRKQWEQERQRIAEQQRRRDGAHLPPEKVKEDRTTVTNANNSYSSDPPIDERRKHEEQRRNQWEQERQRIADEQRRTELNQQPVQVNEGRKTFVNNNNSHNNDSIIDNMRKDAEERNRLRDEERRRIDAEQRRRDEIYAIPDRRNEDRKSVANGTDSYTTDPRSDERRKQVEERRKQWDRERQRVAEEQRRRNDLLKQSVRVPDYIQTVVNANDSNSNGPRMNNTRIQEEEERNRYRDDDLRKIPDERRRMDETPAQPEQVNEGRKTFVNNDNSHNNDSIIDNMRKDAEERNRLRDEERRKIDAEQRRRDEIYAIPDRRNEDRKSVANGTDSYTSDPRTDDRRKQVEERRKQWDRERQRVAEEQRKRNDLLKQSVRVPDYIQTVVNANDSNSNGPRKNNTRIEEEEERNRHRDDERRKIPDQRRRMDETPPQPEQVNEGRKTIANNNNTHSNDSRIDERRRQYEERRKQWEQERGRIAEEQRRRNELQQPDRINEDRKIIANSNDSNTSNPRTDEKRKEEEKRKRCRDEERRKIAEEQRKRNEAPSQPEQLNEGRKTVANGNNSYSNDPRIDERRKQEENRRKQWEEERQRIAEEQRRRNELHQQPDRINEDRKISPNDPGSNSSDPRIEETRREEWNRARTKEGRLTVEEQRRRDGVHLQPEGVNEGRKTVMNGNNSYSNDSRIDERRKQEEERRKQWEQERQRAAEEQRRRSEYRPRPDQVSQDKKADTNPHDSYQARLREYEKMKKEREQMLRQRIENSRQRGNSEKSQEELERERKLQDYIARNTPIDNRRLNQPESITLSRSRNPQQTDHERQQREQEKLRIENEYRKRLQEEQIRRNEENRKRLEQEQATRNEDRRRLQPDQRREFNRPSVTENNQDSQADRRRINDPYRETDNQYPPSTIRTPEDLSKSALNRTDRNRPQERPHPRWQPFPPAVTEASDQSHEEPENIDRAEWNTTNNENQKQPEHRPNWSENENNDRYLEFKRTEQSRAPWDHEHRRRNEDERLGKSLGRPTIIADGRGGGNGGVNATPNIGGYVDNRSPAPLLSLRQAFGDEIDFLNASPAWSGPQAARFPAPPTTRPPVKGPPACVWAIVVCCRNRSDRDKLRRCFEGTDCSRAIWDDTACHAQKVAAANREIMLFYLRGQTPRHQKSMRFEG